MLVEIRISNFALIDELDLQFDDHLNILTGETGAGKSIIVGAVELLLGERASSESIRSGAQKAVVEGLFDISNYHDLLITCSEKGVDVQEGTLLLRREITVNGRNRCFLNGGLATATIFKSISEHLFDLHGQHQHQSLLDNDKQLDLFDGFAQTLMLRNKVGELYRNHQDILNSIKATERKEGQLKEKLSLYQFQIEEIEKSKINPGEDEELETEKQVLENFENLASHTGEIYDKLFADEDSIIDKLASIQKQLEEIGAIDRSTGGFMELCESSYFQLSELARNVKSYLDKLEFDPERLREIRERLDTFYSLKKKYGNSLEEILNYLSTMKVEVDLIGSYDDELKRLKAEEEKVRQELGEKALDLSRKRDKAATKFENLVSGELVTLGMTKGDFSVGMTRIEDKNGVVKADRQRYRLTENGIEEVNFLISLNIGEDLKPLSKIASGGESSRIMLALKTILADTDKIPTLIFDEIDVGIGGKVATTVGEKLDEVSKRHQVLVVTHLPQIASKADHHLLVEKRLQNGRTVTSVKELHDEDRVIEIARLLGGDPESSISRKHASQLLGIANDQDENGKSGLAIEM